MTQQMYIGPNIPGIAKRGTVYLEGLPGALAVVIKEMPEVGNLVVPMGQATAAMLELSEQGSARNISYAKVLDSLGKRAK